jgi:ABC-type Fe3+/spermidine/putrescine transport system ATPase subunit
LKFGLQAEGLRKSIGKAEVLRNISFALEEGVVGAIVGPSGAGKTTLLNALSGLVPLGSGRVVVDGAVVESAGGARGSAVHVSPAKRNIGYVFQDYLLFPHMTVYDNVAYGLKARKLAGADVRQKVLRVLTMVGLEGLGERRPDQLSGGQSQRVALARAIVLEPKVLFLDEPLSALDRPTREGLRVELKRVFEETAMTVVYVTHDLDEAFFLGHKIGLLRSGELSFFGTKAELVGSMNDSTAEFLGFNILRGRLLGIEGQESVLSSRDWGGNLYLPIINASGEHVGRDVAVAVPPGSVRISQPTSNERTCTLARIEEIWEFRDRVQVLLVGTSGGRLVSELPNLEFQGRPLAKGDLVSVNVRSGMIMMPTGQ